MLALSPLRCDKNERENQIQSMEGNEFNLLDAIDFEDFFVGIDGGEMLPDLEMDPEILAEKLEENGSGENGGAPAASVSGLDVGSGSGSDSAVVDGKREEAVVVNRCSKEGEKGKKSSGNCKNPPGKKKVKVDWTPELHRRFVQAVEQLGLDKAVPSRILELMGTDSLTRHNIASHLQKYRSHRKHLLAREAEAARWSQRRQMYGTAAAAAAAAAGKVEANPWFAPTMGFPPVTPMPHFRPLLHVWGHPSMDQSLMHTWPKHLAPPPHAWPPPPLQADPSFWPHRQYVPTPGTPCFAPHFPPTRFPTPPVPGVPAPALYKVDAAIQTMLAEPPSDVQPSKESIDAAIGDVLTKPWLPLPLGLKPPSIDSVMAELQHQGISKIPPTCP